MAIKGNILQVTLPEVRKIKIGRKGEETVSGKGNTFRPPQKLDHFEFLKMVKDEAGNFQPDTDFLELLKKNQDVILDDKGDVVGFPVRLLYNDPDLNFQARLAKYLGAACICTGDGETATHYKKGEVSCPCEFLTDKTIEAKDRCKILGKLSVVVDGDSSFGGCSVFRTTSRNTAESLLGAMKLYREMTGGMLAWLPLHLVVVPKTTQVNGINQTIFVVSLMYMGNPEEFRKIAMTKAIENKQYLISMDEIESRAKDEANGSFLGNDEKEIAEEFFPDSVSASKTITVPDPIDTFSTAPINPGTDNVDTQPSEAPKETPVDPPTNQQLTLPGPETSVVVPQEPQEKVAEAPTVPEASATLTPGNGNGHVGPITKEQIKEIVAIRKKLDWGTVNWNAALTEFKPGLTTAKDLNTEEAARFIAWLQDDLPF